MNLEKNRLILAAFKVGVNNVIFSVDSHHHKLLVLLVKRQKKLFNNQWSLPRTLVKSRESLEEASQRILSEKIRVNNLYLEQLYTFERQNQDPIVSLDSFSTRYLSVSYFALVRFEEAELLSINNYNLTTWCMIQKVPQLVFNHNQIINYGYQRLRNKFEYSPIAFEILPDLFTLNDLYQVYTTILGENFADYSNFRSRLLKLGFLIDTEKKVSRGAGRPASLYRFDAEAFAPFKDKPFVFV
ncbi:MAG: NUDIX hydrolase [cyanobacterium endosymbiont of Rhopalodia musculus]|uniref:NUDIX hydrolase n=1 Tax=cyanobacterium endosymbiont of Epithemia clementina EcSB TaxID=3034674 RepID=UPI00247FDEAF|nr:NUDIX domain-containing protein [cyanobacterium endosymbiont of Epithemia clementina EcSB]WGT67120.1 NUDIX domain-containing protein [cyanobacterium endosymbiont of Epithemia clementina EcSB]